MAGERVARRTPGSREEEGRKRQERSKSSGDRERHGDGREVRLARREGVGGRGEQGKRRGPDQTRGGKEAEDAEARVPKGDEESETVRAGQKSDGRRRRDGTRTK